MQWEWAEDFYPDEEFCAELNGPYGTWIEFGRTLFVVHPPLKWGAFVDDQEVQKSIVALCEAIVLCLGGKAILYVPDSAYCPSRASDFIFEDVDFDFLIDFLHKQCSPSAATISEIGRDLSNEEMLSLVPSWSVGSEGRIRNYDGYYVKYF